MVMIVIAFNNLILNGVDDSFAAVALTATVPPGFNSVSRLFKELEPSYGNNASTS